MTGARGAAIGMALADCRLLALPRIEAEHGNLTYIECPQQVPFAIRRVFFLDAVPGDARRAGHALRTCTQLIVAAAGSFDVQLDDGVERRLMRLERSSEGLLVPPLTWCELERFSPGALCLVLASEPFDEQGYVRSYDGFRALVARGG